MKNVVTRRKIIVVSHFFFKGAVVSDGKVRHPLPNTRFQAIIHMQSVDKYREYAKKLLRNSSLDKKHHVEFMNCYGMFYKAYDQLLELLNKPGGKGVSFRIDTIDVREAWRDFLVNGRILLDFLGLHCRTVLKLNQSIGGLNEKKFNFLLATLEKQGSTDIKNKLELLKGDIITFIEFRNIEKLRGDTIVNFPAVDIDYGVIKDGEIRLNERKYNMIEFINSSYKSVLSLTITLLGTSHPTGAKKGAKKGNISA